MRRDEVRSDVEVRVKISGSCVFAVMALSVFVVL